MPQLTRRAKNNSPKKCTRQTDWVPLTPVVVRCGKSLHKRGSNSNSPEGKEGKERQKSRTGNWPALLPAEIRVHRLGGAAAF